LAVNSAVGSAVNSAVGSAVGSAVDSAVRSAGFACIGGSLWAGYAAYYDYMNEVLNIDIHNISLDILVHNISMFRAINGFEPNNWY